MAIRMSMDEYNQRLVAGQNDSAKHDALYDARQRIAQLEALNATLAAQLDRQAAVVQAAKILAISLRRQSLASWSGPEEALERAITTYEQQMAVLAKGVGE